MTETTESSQRWLTRGVGGIGTARLAGGAIADDPQRRRAQAVAGYATTAVLSSLIGAATSLWQVGVLRAGAWAARGLRVPAGNALLADIVPAAVYGRADGFERAMDNLGAIAGPCSPWPWSAWSGSAWPLPVGHPRAAGRPGHRIGHRPPPHAPRCGSRARCGCAAGRCSPAGSAA